MAQKNIDFRYRPRPDSQGGLLADYLQQSPERTKDKILDTVKMCWGSAALLKGKNPNATEAYVSTLNALADHIRLLTKLHKFDKQEAWQILKNRLSDFAENEDKEMHEKLDRLLELCENGISVNNSTSEKDSEEKESYLKDDHQEKASSEGLDFFT